MPPIDYNLYPNVKNIKFNNTPTRFLDVAMVNYILDMKNIAHFSKIIYTRGTIKNKDYYQRMFWKDAKKYPTRSQDILQHLCIELYITYSAVNCIGKPEKYINYITNTEFYKSRKDYYTEDKTKPDVIMVDYIINRLQTMFYKNTYNIAPLLLTKLQVSYDVGYIYPQIEAFKKAHAKKVFRKYTNCFIAYHKKIKGKPNPLHLIMNLVDNQSQNIPEQEYIQICNELKRIHLLRTKGK